MRALLIIILLFPTLATAQTGTLVGIPQLSGGEGFNGYINAVYAMFISIAALLAVVKIIVAGVKYMFSDIATQKSDAKKDIRGALLGLLVVLAAVLILTIINPNLTNFDASSINRLDETTPVSIAAPNSQSQELTQLIQDIESNRTNRSCVEVTCIPERIACESGELFQTENATGRFESFSRGGENVYTCEIVLTQETQETLEEGERQEQFEEVLVARQRSCNDNPGLLWNNETNRCYYADPSPVLVPLEEILYPDEQDERTKFVLGALTRQGYDFSDTSLLQNLIANNNTPQGIEEIGRICDLMTSAYTRDSIDITEIKYTLSPQFDGCTFVDRTITNREAPENFQIPESLLPED